MIEQLYNIQLNQSNIPVAYKQDVQLYVQKEDMESFNILKSIELDVVNFVKSGKNLYLYSALCGNGKTTWACRIAKAYMKNYTSNYAIDSPVYFINVPDYIYTKKQAISNPSLVENCNEADYNIKNARLVIWDDIATKMLSEYDMELLYSLINYRVSNGKSNIYTSNTYDNLEKTLGARLYSRIVNGSITVQLRGKDRRRS